jgi:hypothetical protein
MYEASRLVLNSPHHLGMAMAGVRHADTAGEVQVANSIGVPNVGALTAVNY